MVTPALLLHVTPSVAAEASVTRLPAPQALPPAAPATPAAPAAPEATVIAPTLDNGQPNDVQIVIDKHGKGYRHSWTSAAGTRFTVISNSEADLTPAERQQMEAELAKARAEVEASRAEIQRATHDAQYAVAISRTQMEMARKQVEAARREVSKIDQAKIDAAMKRAQAVLDDPAMQRRLADATAKADPVRIQRALDRAEAALKDPAHHPGVIILKDVEVRSDDDAEAPAADAPK